jgi:hypothetical protein
LSHPIYKNINQAIIYVPGSSHAYIRQNHQDITTRISKLKRINYKWISLLQLNQESVQGTRKRKINTWRIGRHRDVGSETTPRNRRVRWCSPPRRLVLNSSRRCPRENRGVEKASVSTQLVLNKYTTNYEALGLADSTALAFWQNFIKANYYKWMNYHKPELHKKLININ